VFFRFQGGKGVATALGVLFGVDAVLGLAAGVVWLLMAVLFRYSSLSSLTAAVGAPLIYVLADGTAWYAETPVLLALVAMAALLVYRHRENIQRLLAGTESRLGQKKKQA
jgi:glycerol-3-phosphate acyltransferase PlsY